jgi:hypothetical protein
MQEILADHFQSGAAVLRSRTGKLGVTDQTCSSSVISLKQCFSECAGRCLARGALSGGIPQLRLIPQVPGHERQPEATTPLAEGGRRRPTF